MFPYVDLKELFSAWSVSGFADTEVNASLTCDSYVADAGQDGAAWKNANSSFREVEGL